MLRIPNKSKNVMSDKYLQELLALPFGLEKIDSLDGYPIYSSDSLKEKFNTAISTLKAIRPCLSKVVSLVKEDRVIPCVSYSGFLSYIVKKTISHQSNMVFQGAYDVNKNVIYIVADMKFADFIQVDQHMAYILIHELMHYCSKKKPGVFFNIFKGEYQKYYIELFHKFAQAELTKQQAEKIAKYATQNYELGKDENFVRYTRFLSGLLDEKQFSGSMTKTHAISIMMSTTNSLFKGFDVFVSHIRRDPDARRLVEVMYAVYVQDFGIKDPDTTPIQELIYPSEIPAVTSIRPNNLHYSAINKIA